MNDQNPSRSTGNPASSGLWHQIRGPLGWIVAGVLAAYVLNVSYRRWRSEPAEIAQSFDQDAPLVQDSHAPVIENAKQPTPAPKKDHEPDGFLDAFTKKDGPSDNEGSAAALSNADLEAHFQALVNLSSQLNELKRRAKSDALTNDKDFEQAEAASKRLLEQFNRLAQTLEKALPIARQARPKDAVPRWLTGELLMLVGGEPEEVMPHLQFALAQGLKKPRLLGSLVREKLGANEFAAAYALAEKAVAESGTDRYLWNAFMQAAVGTQHFDAFLKRLERTFPTGLPAWAVPLRRDAQQLQTLWQAEEKIRRAEAQADDLPRVRLVIEHRRFAKDKDGQPLTTIESTGRAEVVVELFENEAPNTVANFLDLASRKFYDGTTFHLVLPAIMAASGDPNTKNSDPADDGAGGPGYHIPDEFHSPRARNLFRGSLAMVNTGPQTAGSQFFFTLTPQMEMNGHFTVFGRVIQGQEAVDRITRGRTTRALGQFGRIIPGDLLVRAEVVRKRSHEYRVTKVQP